MKEEEEEEEEENWIPFRDVIYRFDDCGGLRFRTQSANGGRERNANFDERNNVESPRVRKEGRQSRNSWFSSMVIW